MKTYENIIDGIRYWYFYDKHVKSWTVFKVDNENNQVGDAEHYAHKESLLKDYEFNFKKIV